MFLKLIVVNITLGAFNFQVYCFITSKNHRNWEGGKKKKKKREGKKKRRKRCHTNSKINTLNYN